MVLKYNKIKFLNIDKITYAGNLANIKKIKNLKNYNYVKLDICNYKKLNKI